MSEKQQPEVQEELEAVETPEQSVEQQAAPEELTEEQKYQAQIEELEAKLADEEGRHLRLRADFDNVRRRQQSEKAAMEKYRAQALLTDILPVLDNFERALQVEPASEEAISIVKGIEMVYSSLVEAVKKEGLEVIAAEGEEFDPNVHQAVMQEHDEDKASGIVLREMQKGYKLKDRVLRPSMVSVNE